MRASPLDARCTTRYGLRQSEPIHELQHHIVEVYRQRIQIIGVSTQAKTLRLEWDRAAAGKWVKQGDRICLNRSRNLLRRPPEQIFVV